MPAPRKRLTVLRLRQKLREVRLDPRHELARLVHRLKGIFASVFVGHAGSARTDQPATTPDGSRSVSIRSSTPLPPPRQTPPGYQSIRCVTPSELEQGLHDDAPPAPPYQQYFPFRSHDDLRAAEAHGYHARELQAIDELRQARRRASSGFSRQRLMSDAC